MAAFQIGKVPPLLPELRDDLGFGLVGAGWVLSVFNLLGMLCGAAIGVFAARAGERRAMLFGLWTVASGTLIGAGAESLSGLIAARALEGFGFLLVSVPAPALIVRAAPGPSVRVAFGLWGAYHPAGAAMMMVATPLLAGLLGWRGLWLVNAGLVAAYALVFARLTQGLNSRAPARFADMWATMRSPGPLLLAGVFMVYAAQWIVMIGFLPTLLREASIAAGTAARLTALMIAVNALGNLAAGFSLRHGVPRVALVSLAAMTMAAASFVVFAGEAVTWRYLAAVAFSLVGGLLPASILAGAAIHAPEPRLIAATNGLIVQGSSLGQFVTPPIAAALALAVGGWQATPFLFAGLGLAAVIGALLLHRRERR